MKRIHTCPSVFRSVTMKKFLSSYYGETGNGNKPCHRFWSQNVLEEGSPYQETHPSSSFRPKRPEKKPGVFRGYNHMVADHKLENNEGKRLNSAGYRKFHKTHNFQGISDVKNNGGNSHPKRPGPPPGLKGKEIGLWYRDRQKALSERKTGVEEKKEHPELIMSSESQDLIKQVLQTSGIVIEQKEKLNDFVECLSTFEEKVESAELDINVNDEELNHKLYNKFKMVQTLRSYRDMLNMRKALPSYKMKDSLLESIKENQIVVISGGTGCGKTTQIVQYVLDDYILRKKGSLCSIICTQPRRISAISIAERVAFERSEILGLSVGYQIRLESVIPRRKRGCINFMTTGILLQLLQTEPILGKTSHLFLDEVHERDINSDLMMALLKYIIPKRPDLKIILMSATLRASSFSKYFGGAPCLEIPGFNYPVEDIFLEDILKKTKFRFDVTKKPNPGPGFNEYILPYVRDLALRKAYPKSVINQLENPMSEVLNIGLITEVIRYICLEEDDGAILVFLPGLGDILSVQRELRNSSWFSDSKYVVYLMHSILPTSNQVNVFNIPPNGMRKIILATSILETSITVNDVVYVVDCGKLKYSGFDIKHKVATLEPQWISLANAKQRSGRAGRTKNGKCYKLYTKVRQDIFEQYPIPEMKTTSLEQVILQAKLLQLGHVAQFLEKVMDPPEPDMIELSLKVLRDLNALDDKERLTSLGYYLSKLPMDPHTGKMIIMATIFRCVDPIFSIAACLSFKDPFVVQVGNEDAVNNVKKYFAGDEKSDHLIYSEILRQWEDQDSWSKPAFADNNFLASNTMNLLSEMKRQFADLLHSMNFMPNNNVKDPLNNINSENLGIVKAVICAGLYPNVAILRKVKKVALLKTMDHGTVRFHIKSYCQQLNHFESPFFVYHMKLKSTGIFIHDATMMNFLPMLLFGKNLNITCENGYYYISGDNKIKFKVEKNLGVSIKELKDLLDRVLWSVISNPKRLDWNESSEETKVLNSVEKLISAENNSVGCSSNFFH